jgi:hypothetical protein
MQVKIYIGYSEAIRILGSANVNINSLKYTYNVSPWWTYNVQLTIAGHIKSINGVAWEHVAKYNSQANSHINKALGVEG